MERKKCSFCGESYPKKDNYEVTDSDCEKVTS